MPKCSSSLVSEPTLRQTKTSSLIRYSDSMAENHFATFPGSNKQDQHNYTR